MGDTLPAGDVGLGGDHPGIEVLLPGEGLAERLDHGRRPGLLWRVGPPVPDALGDGGDHPVGRDAAPGSDLDILVTSEAGAGRGLTIVALHQALEDLLRRPIDLLMRGSVERSPNTDFRRLALRTTEPPYERA